MAKGDNLPVKPTVTPAAKLPAPAPTGTIRSDSGGRGQQGRRKGLSHSQNRQSNSGARSTPVSNFKGLSKEMMGNIFQTFKERKDAKQFSKTIEAVGVYIAKNMEYPGDMTVLTKELIKPVIPELFGYHQNRKAESSHLGE